MLGCLLSVENPSSDLWTIFNSRKTKLRPQSRVLMKSTKKGTKFSEGWGEGEYFLFKNHDI